MGGQRAWIDSWIPHRGQLAIALGLILVNFVFNVISGTAFRLSADSPNLQQFLFWQVVGNIAGFLTVVTLTALLRIIPLHIAYPLTTGLAVIGIQVLAAAWVFHESISARGWIGTALIVTGIILIGQRGR